MTDDQLLDRATAAYYQTRARGDAPAARPDRIASGVEEVAGMRYVVLRNASAVVSVYRVRTSGVLKSLRRWPKELDS